MNEARIIFVNYAQRFWSGSFVNAGNRVVAIRKTRFFSVQSTVNFCTMVCYLYLSNMWYRVGHGGTVVLLRG
jgi:hypothetical protein